LEDKSKTDKKTLDETSEDIKEPKVEEQPKIETEKSEDQQKEKAEEDQSENKSEEVKGEKQKEKEEQKIPTEQSEDTKEEKDKAVETKEKPVKAQEKKEEKKKKDDKKSDFKYIVRLSNTDVDGEKNILFGLTSIKGIGLHMASLITDEIGFDRFNKIGDLSDAQVEKIQKILNDIQNRAPRWMLNHRKDYDTGKDLHLIGSDIDMRLRDEINIMKKIRSYRGIRHERGLPVRGQRTRANSRTGLTLGVSKKREPASK